MSPNKYVPWDDMRQPPDYGSGRDVLTENGFIHGVVIPLRLDLSKPSNVNQMTAWCEENARDSFTYDVLDPFPDEGIYEYIYLFKNPYDAVQFKLRWS